MIELMLVAISLAMYCFALAIDSGAFVKNSEFKGASKIKIFFFYLSRAQEWL